MGQLELFDELVKANNVYEAHLVIKNMYNKNIENKEIFEKYFDFSCMVASWNVELETRKYFIQQAETALVFFSENAVLNQEQLFFIKNCREKIFKNLESISAVEQEMNVKYNNKVVEENNRVLKELVAIKGKLFSAKKQKEFDEFLLSVNEKENALNKERLTAEQKALYDSLTKEYSTIISNKLNEFNVHSNIEYNNTAVKDFKYVFDKFKENEDEFKKSHSQLFSLVSKRLFSYEPAKLFNETLIYYSHVYSFIFSKLDDDGKYKLTQIAIDTEKIKN